MAQSMPDTTALVREFNKLPRPYKLGKYDNRWMFYITPLRGNLHFIFIVHPSGFHNTYGIQRAIDLSNPIAEVDRIVPVLLELFVSGFDMEEFDSHSLGERNVAPWVWATWPDRNLGRAIETQLQAIGVRKELCKVERANLGERAATYNYGTASRRAALTKLDWGNGTNGGAVFCGFCRHSTTQSLEPLHACQGCRKAWYCSNRCRREDRSNHRKNCISNQARRWLHYFCFFVTCLFFLSGLMAIIDANM
jgi:MYND finger